ncbi:Helix-hairpin-helix motif-containing protein [Bacteroidales bacterium WCE2004]|nr:Helix-hairpin-helix motif-containing protein [Bacteroidales bacterium WCE2004]
MKDDTQNRRVRPTAASFKVGAIALAFLILGYQTALFVTRAAGLKLAANRDRPDTVYVYLPADYSPVGSSTRQPSGDSAGPLPLPAEAGPSLLRSRLEEKMSPDRGAPGLEGKPARWLRAGESTPEPVRIERRNAPHSPRAEAYRRATRRVESFRFNPNTVSVEDLIRLGFSEKQARAIDNYRAKGGRFRRKADFARSFVVADSVFRRLERFIDIPKVDLNRADSAALDALPGIGPWFAARIVSYRAELGGYSYPEQLMDIYRFDREKYDALSDLVFCSPPAPFALWSLPADSLRLHPYIRSAQAARSIVLFRDHTPREGWTVAALGEAGILPPEDASRLARCRLSPP